MAIATNRDFAGSEIKVGPRTAMAAFYILVGVVAAGVAIPAALATGAANPGLFDECYSSCAAAR